MNKKIVQCLLLSILVAGCDQADTYTNEVAPNSSSKPDYVVMGQDLQQLKDDFNANRGRVRLLFLNGPTCGICLRGMADLNDEFIAKGQSDDRYVTFVVHVPTMGAKEHHVPDTIALLEGPRIHHYWEESGIIGQHYTEVMDVEMYVWDFWMIYNPDVIWEGTLPPVPDYYEHQLGVTSGKFRGFPKERVLDAERFAAETMKHLDNVEDLRFAADIEIDKGDVELFADGTVIPHVGQPRNVAVRQHIMGRGGFQNLKRIQSIEAQGHIEANGVSQPITIQSERPNVLRRLVGSGDEISIGEVNADELIVIDTGAERVLPADLEQRLLDTFEFDGKFVQWPDKGHEVSMTGMQKFGDVLAWKLSLVQAGGPRWDMFVNSHTGDLVRANMLADGGEPLFAISQSDFRETAGFRFPHRIEYLDGKGRSLAVETIDDIEVDVAPFDLDKENVTH